MKWLPSPPHPLFRSAWAHQGKSLSFVTLALPPLSLPLMIRLWKLMGLSLKPILKSMNDSSNKSILFHAKLGHTDLFRLTTHTHTLFIAVAADIPTYMQGKPQTKWNKDELSGPRSCKHPLKCSPVQAPTNMQMALTLSFQEQASNSFEEVKTRVYVMVVVPHGDCLQSLVVAFARSFFKCLYRGIERVNR